MLAGGRLSRLLILFTFITKFCNLCLADVGVNPGSDGKPNCNLFKFVDANDLSINDIAVRTASGDNVCIKARFSLAVKVESTFEESMIEPDEFGGQKNASNGLVEGAKSKRVIMGYLPLDTVISVEDSCPELPNGQVENKNQPTTGGGDTVSPAQELQMIVVFECGKLAFSFKQEQEKVFMSSLKGLINLDPKIIREFINEEPMFFTSDLKHHFKYNDLIEVNSTAKPKAYFLTANFYNLEFEAFRNTTSRDFVRPPDSESKSYLIKI